MSERRSSWITISVLFAFVLAFGGCAQAPPKYPGKDVAKKQYIIGPGDSLQIYVRNNQDLSTVTPVRPDGKISIPLVQSVQAAGKTPSDLANTLETKLSEYVRNPTVTVIVTNFVGPYSQQIRVVGQATQPQAIAYRSGMTLLDVMIQVGGLTKFAAGNRAKLVRKVKGQKKTYGVKLEDLLNGDISDNVRVRPGDVIIIPRALF